MDANTDGNGAPTGGYPGEPAQRERTEEELANIYAAMMEELGIERKDALPLHDGPRGGSVGGGSMTLSSLKPKKRLNEATAAWRNIQFDDVDPSQELLDNIADGQLYRLRRGASTISRGGRGVSSGGHGRNNNDCSRARGGFKQVSNPGSYRGGHAFTEVGQRQNHSSAPTPSTFFNNPKRDDKHSRIEIATARLQAIPHPSKEINPPRKTANAKARGTGRRPPPERQSSTLQSTSQGRPKSNILPPARPAYALSLAGPDDFFARMNPSNDVKVSKAEGQAPTSNLTAGKPLTMVSTQPAPANTTRTPVALANDDAASTQPSIPAMTSREASPTIADTVVKARTSQPDPAMNNLATVTSGSQTPIIFQQQPHPRAPGITSLRSGPNQSKQPRPLISQWALPETKKSIAIAANPCDFSIVIEAPRVEIQQDQLTPKLGVAKLLKYHGAEYYTLEASQNSMIVLRSQIYDTATFTATIASIVYQSGSASPKWSITFPTLSAAQQFANIVLDDRKKYLIPRQIPESTMQWLLRTSALSNDPAEGLENSVSNGQSGGRTEVLIAFSSDDDDGNADATDRAGHGMSNQVPSQTSEAADVERLISLSDSEDDEVDAKETAQVESAVRDLQGMTHQSPFSQPIFNHFDSLPGGLLAQLRASIVLLNLIPPIEVSGKDLLKSNVYQLAAKNMVSEFLSRSEYFQLLPDRFAFDLLWQESRNIIEAAAALDTSEQESAGDDVQLQEDVKQNTAPIAKNLPRRYSVAELKKYRVDAEPVAEDLSGLFSPAKTRPVEWNALSTAAHLASIESTLQFITPSDGPTKIISERSEVTKNEPAPASSQGSRHVPTNSEVEVRLAKEFHQLKLHTENDSVAPLGPENGNIMLTSDTDIKKSIGTSSFADTSVFATEATILTEIKDEKPMLSKEPLVQGIQLIKEEVTEESTLAPRKATPNAFQSSIPRFALAGNLEGVADKNAQADESPSTPSWSAAVSPGIKGALATSSASLFQKFSKPHENVASQGSSTASSLNACSLNPKNESFKSLISEDPNNPDVTSTSRSDLSPVGTGDNSKSVLQSPPKPSLFCRFG